jgi:hypothetical protein
MNQQSQRNTSPTTIDHTTSTAATSPTDRSHQSGPEETTTLGEPIGPITTDTRTIPYPIPAVEPFPSSDNPSNILHSGSENDNHVPLTFNIRFASDGSVPDLLNVWVGDRESVREFKRRVGFFSRSFSLKKPFIRESLLLLLLHCMLIFALAVVFLFILDSTLTSFSGLQTSQVGKSLRLK